MTSRRDAVHALASIAALPFLGTRSVEELIDAAHRAHEALARRRTGAPYAPRALTASEYRIVTQAAERIIPRTATPGATDAHVADFIDVMLADWYDPPDVTHFKAGLAELNARARNTGGKPFVELAEPDQIKLLEALDAELQARRSAAQDIDQDWFAMLKHLTVWGYYTSQPGITEELRIELIPGRYDGNAAY
jgi:hypothetical protein